MEKKLHIVAFDVPYPLNYGGIIELYYKIVALHAAGVKIHLHCWEYGRSEQPALNQYCEKVYYYKRQVGHKGFSFSIPYIVSSRCCPELRENLLQDNHPILLEGIHCTSFIDDKRFENRKIVLRLHNVEYKYYQQLSKCSSNTDFAKKMYYYYESRLLRKHEKKVASKLPILALCEEDAKVYREEFGAREVKTIPVFIPFEKVQSEEGMGCFCLYHGNLSVSENEQAVIWLLEKVFHELPIHFIIAGKDPSEELTQLANSFDNVCLIPNPSNEELQDLINKAQVNVVPSFNNTGIKLKLLNSLTNGRHCVANDAAVKGTGLESCCHIGSDAVAFQHLISELYYKPFTDDEIKLRQHLIDYIYNNRKNAQKLIEYLW